MYITGDWPGVTLVRATYNGAHPFAASQKTNIGVSNLTVYGDGNTPESDGCKIYACTNAVIDNVVAHDLYEGIACYSNIGSRVTNCTAYNCSNVGIDLSTSYLTLQAGVNNVATNCEAYACTFGLEADGYYDTTPRKRCNGSSFVNCNAHDNRSFGFRFNYADNAQMTDCTATNNGTAASGAHYNVYLCGVINDGDGVTGDAWGIVPAAGTGCTIHNTTYGGGGVLAATIQTASTPSDGVGYFYYHYCASSGIVVN